MLAFTTPTSALGCARACAPTSTAKSPRWRRRSVIARNTPRASLDAIAPAILIADDIYGEIARGGVGIVLSGVVGAFCVGLMMKGNMAEVRVLDIEPQVDRYYPCCVLTSSQFNHVHLIYRTGLL
jgi:hypothetical protein